MSSRFLKWFRRPSGNNFHRDSYCFVTDPRGNDGRSGKGHGRGGLLHNGRIFDQFGQHSHLSRGNFDDKNSSSATCATCRDCARLHQERAGKKTGAHPTRKGQCVRAIPDSWSKSCQQSSPDRGLGDGTTGAHRLRSAGSLKSRCCAGRSRALCGWAGTAW